MPDPVLNIDQPDRLSVAEREAARTALEQGTILVLSRAPFGLTDAEKALLFQRKKGKASRAAKLRKLAGKEPDQSERGPLLARYAQWTRRLVIDLFPDYARALEAGPTEFRAGARKRPQPVHLDFYYQRPTQGRRLLRVFTNVHPNGQERVWDVGEGFGTFARRHAHRLKRDIPGRAWMLNRLGITKGPQKAYDHAMLQLRAAAEAEFKNGQSLPTVSFPAGSTWIGYTDSILHADRSGQYAFEQTFVLPVEAMAHKEASPLGILESLTGRRMA